jgi:hypothetical protein
MKQHLAQINVIRERVKKGDKQAQRELIAICRRGMLEPYWEGRR